jgi:hypothetical protein
MDDPMETIMTHRDPYSDDDRLQAGRSLEPVERTSPRQALWSAITALAIVVVLFVVFYGISAQRDEGSAVRTTANPSTTTAPPTTTGQGGPRDQGAGQGGAQDQGGAQKQGGDSAK